MFDVKAAAPGTRFSARNKLNETHYYELVAVLETPDSTGNNVLLRAIGEDEEQHRQDLEKLLRDNPYNERFQKMSLEEFCTFGVEFGWFDYRKITVLEG